MSVWTTANTGGLETPSKSPIASSVPRTARSPAVIATTGNHQQHHFQHVVAAAVAAATSVATGHQFQQQFPLQPHSHPHPHHNNSPTGSGSNSNNSAGFQRSSISNSLLQFPPPPPPHSSQNQAKAAPFELIVEFEYTSSLPLSYRCAAAEPPVLTAQFAALLAEPYQFS